MRLGVVSIDRHRWNAEDLRPFPCGQGEYVRLGFAVYPECRDPSQRRLLLGELFELGCPGRDLRGRRGVICGQGQYHLVDRRRKVAAHARGGDEAAAAVDADGDGHTATRLRGVTDVGNDRPVEESSRSALTFQPVRKPLPRIAARDVACSAIWTAQPHEGKVEL